MANLYAALIRRGLWTLEQVPVLWRAEVEKLMEESAESNGNGTEKSPILASACMEYVYGLYYFDSEDGKTYLCKRIGEEDGGTIILQYLPHELVGQYFEEVL